MEVTESLDFLNRGPLPNELLFHGPDLSGGNVPHHFVEAGLGYIGGESVVQFLDNGLQFGRFSRIRLGLRQRGVGVRR